MPRATSAIGERAGLLGEDHVEHDLVQQVAQLVDERDVLAGRPAAPAGASGGRASSASTTSYASSSR